MAHAKVDARAFEMHYIHPLFQFKVPTTRKNGEKLGVGETVNSNQKRFQSRLNDRFHLTGANALNLENSTPVVTATPSGINMENAKLEDVTSLSIVYTETQPSKIGATFDSLWESNRLINECLEGLRNDKLEREKQQKKEKDEREKQQKKEKDKREKQQKKERDEREMQKKEQEAWYLAMEERLAGVAVLEKTVAELKLEVDGLKEERAENRNQRTADKQKYDKDNKDLKDVIAAGDAKIEAFEAKVESQDARILGLEGEVRTLNQARHDDQEAYRAPLFLRILLDDARDKIAHLLDHSWWDDISSNQLPSQLPTWLAQQRPLVESDYTLTNTSLAILSRFNPIRQEGNEVAHTVTTKEIREAILSRQQESVRVVLKNLFEFTYEEDLPLTTSS
ncbi:unnamed protein product [Cyclocybe aegerita]|uniref:Uncharacterized protein n=1 Tax=Cyclocybe aegerita TaxID=1973307 RepID=A0A8S0WPR2_CYCAE|nr:unnamed protein product [Cyclocybe aegerita]